MAIMLIGLIGWLGWAIAKLCRLSRWAALMGVSACRPIRPNANRDLVHLAHLSLANREHYGEHSSAGTRRTVPRTPLRPVGEEGPPQQRGIQTLPMSLSADTNYIDWLSGRKIGDRDRAPAFARIKTLFGNRLQQDRGKRPLMPQPAWATNRRTRRRHRRVGGQCRDQSQGGPHGRLACRPIRASRSWDLCHLCQLSCQPCQPEVR